MNIGPVAAATATNNPQAAQSLGLQDFMKILLTQLTYQDPMKPMDNQEFMAQMAQFTALEQSLRLNDRMQQLIDTHSALQSVGLIGRTVEISTPTGRVSGTVSSLSLQGEAPVMSVTVSGGAVLADVSLSRLLSVR